MRIHCSSGDTPDNSLQIKSGELGVGEDDNPPINVYGSNKHHAHAISTSAPDTLSAPASPSAHAHAHANVSRFRRKREQ